MPPNIPNHWLYPPDLKVAAQVQRELAAKVIRDDQFSAIHRVGGSDVSNNPRDPENRIYAALLALDFPSLKPLESQYATATAPLPYVPGFLAFREVPALVEAFQQLSVKPDLILVDGHGVSHPRRLGIASHLGVVLDCPTIGVAKSILVGSPQGEPGNRPGDCTPLVWQGKTIGAVLRTRANVSPVYVSTGHRITLDSAIEWVIRCLTRYRLPEPTRLAHQAANQCRKTNSPTQDSLSLVNPIDSPDEFSTLPLPFTH